MLPFKTMPEVKLFGLAFVILCFITSPLSAQQGPGGVSVESTVVNGGTCRPDTGSTCGMWLDASTLNLADGAEVSTWTDVSLSYDCDDANVPSGVFPPLYRNDPAYTINGLPTLSFEDGRHFILASSDDLNTDNITLEKVVFLAFRTSEDVTSEQVIYEEGGAWRGFNIIIQDGKLIIGAYDKIVDGVPGTNTPAYGYSYIETTVQQNETVILVAEFHVDATGSVGNDGAHFLKGWKNGTQFGGPGNLIGGFTGSGFDGSARLGSLHNHPNPCGLGAVNDDTVTKNQVVSNNSGSRAFKGKFAEVCYYKEAISETQRIIVQNYLAAKYLAPLATDDWYDHEFNYGKDVIGIGVDQGSTVHNLSRGRNPFVVSAFVPPVNNTFRYFLTGHNGLNNEWTDAGVPGNSSNIQRLERIWRVDERGISGNLLLQLDTNKLPTSPAGYNTSNSKLVVLIDRTSPNIPDFTLESTEVREMTPIPGNPYDYIFNYNFPNDAFYTFAWLKPEVRFVEDQEIALEANAPASYNKNVQVTLNYRPANNGDAVADGYTLDYTFLAGTANLGPVGSGPPDPDYYYNGSSTPGITSGQISFSETQYLRNIPVRIINDAISENPPTENFTVSITGTGQVGGAIPLLIDGANSNLPFTIYDDDADPKISFVDFADTLSQNESISTIPVQIIRSGNSMTEVTCQIEVVNSGTDALSSASGPDPQDFNDSFITQTVTFPSGVQSIETINIPIINDNVDEVDEFIRLRITNITGDVAIETAESIVQNLKIVDNDAPVASFASPVQSGYESIGAPSLLVTLEPISSRDVVVDFKMVSGTATYSSDYAGAQDGFVIFPPFVDEAFIGPFFVYPDGINEGSETVLFELDSIAPLGDDKMGMSSNLTYTIFDYEPFEWKGVGGVGKSSDNIVWIDASQEALGNINNLTNRAPYPLSITRIDNDPANNQANRINGKNALDFNGNSNTNGADAYQIENSNKINTAGTVDKLSYFMVFKTDVGGVPTSTATPNNPTTTEARLLYEQGGGTRGTSIYIYNERLYFHAWNNANDDGGDNVATTDTIEGNQAPWGNNGNRINSAWAVSSQLIEENKPYVVSCHYSNFSSEPLRIYVNGIKGTTNVPSVSGANPFGVGRLWGHSGAIGLGAVVNGTRFHFSNGSPSERRSAFDGKIAEFISYHEPEMSEARRVIIENYLSGKYDIQLDDADTPQAWNITDPLRDTFRDEIAGLGQEAGGNSAHSDSQGPTSICRVSSPVFNGSNEGYLMWGSNGEELTNTWPFTDASMNFPLPSGIGERSGQVWKFYKKGDVTSARISIDFNASNNAGALSASSSYLKLLVHTNADPQDFSTASVYNLSGPAVGGVAVFNNVPITDGMYVTLGNTQDYFTTPLPIELLDFDAKYNGDNVILNWSTASEQNNEKFIVERAGEDLRFQPVLTRDGAGNSNTILFYNDIDENPLNGLSYYRLKQVDYDGSFEYSDPVSVFIELDDQEFAFKLFPNPNKNGALNIFVAGNLDTRENIVIEIMDMTGNKILDSQLSPEIQSKTIQLPNYIQAGMYLVRFSNNEIDKTYKLVISN